MEIKWMNDFVIVIMVDGSEKRDCEGGSWTLEVRMFVKSAVIRFFLFFILFYFIFFHVIVLEG